MSTTSVRGAEVGWGGADLRSLLTAVQHADRQMRRGCDRVLSVVGASVVVGRSCCRRLVGRIDSEN